MRPAASLRSLFRTRRPEARPHTGLWMLYYARNLRSKLGNGVPAAQTRFRLMLLGSPPDMVRGHPLRETGSAAACGGLFHSLSILLYVTKFINQKFLLSRKKYALQ